MVTNTVALPQEAWGTVQSDIMQVQSLSNAASLLSGNAGSIVTRLQSASGYANQAASLGNIAGQFTTWQQTIGNNINTLGRTLGLQQSQEANDAALLKTLEAHSQDARGQMQAIQAGNELAHANAVQLQEIEATLTATAQLQATGMAVDADRRAAERAAMLHFSKAQPIQINGYPQYRGHTNADLEGECCCCYIDRHYSSYCRGNIPRRESNCHGKLCCCCRRAGTISRKAESASRQVATAKPWAKILMPRRSLALGAALALAILFSAGSAHAQSANVLDQVVVEFRNRSAGWEGILRSFALHTFAILAVIELAWAGIRLAFRGADLSDWLAEIVNQILFLGFFLALLENSVTWGRRLLMDSGRRPALRAAAALHHLTCSRQVYNWPRK